MNEETQKFDFDLITKKLIQYKKENLKIFFHYRMNGTYASFERGGNYLIISNIIDLSFNILRKNIIDTYNFIKKIIDSNHQILSFNSIYLTDIAEPTYFGMNSVSLHKEFEKSYLHYNFIFNNNTILSNEFIQNLNNEKCHHFRLNEHFIINKSNFSEALFIQFILNSKKSDFFYSPKFHIESNIYLSEFNYNILKNVLKINNDLETDNIIQQKVLELKNILKLSPQSIIDEYTLITKNNDEYDKDYDDNNKPYKIYDLFKSSLSIEDLEILEKTYQNHNEFDKKTISAYFDTFLTRETMFNYIENEKINLKIINTNGINTSLLLNSYNYFKNNQEHILKLILRTNLLEKGYSLEQMDLKTLFEDFYKEYIELVELEIDFIKNNQKSKLKDFLECKNKKLLLLIDEISNANNFKNKDNINTLMILIYYSHYYNFVSTNNYTPKTKELKYSEIFSTFINKIEKYFSSNPNIVLSLIKQKKLPKEIITFINENFCNINKQLNFTSQTKKTITVEIKEIIPYLKSLTKIEIEDNIKNAIFKCSELIFKIQLTSSSKGVYSFIEDFTNIDFVYNYSQVNHIEESELLDKTLNIMAKYIDIIYFDDNEQSKILINELNSEFNEYCLFKKFENQESNLSLKQEKINKPKI